MPFWSLAKIQHHAEKAFKIAIIFFGCSIFIL
jgi:hypothetical protein